MTTAVLQRRAVSACRPTVHCPNHRTIALYFSRGQRGRDDLSVHPLVAYGTQRVRLKTTLNRVEAVDVSVKPRVSAQEALIPLSRSFYNSHPLFPTIELQRRSRVQSLTGNDDLASTRPAPLDLVALDRRDDGSVTLQGRVTYWFHLGKAYLKFYKTGLKNIWTNYKEVREIKAQLGPYTLNQAAKYGGQSITSDPQRKVPIITRRQYQLCLRTHHDLGKLAPFCLILLICGEFTPLVVLALGSSVVPLTCRIPGQREKDRKKLIRRFNTWRRELNKLSYLNEDPQKRYWFGTNATEFENRSACIFGYRMGVNPISKPIPGLASVYYRFFVRRRLEQLCEEILCDTILIRREGGFQRLSPEEVAEYAEKYDSFTFLWYLANQRDCRNQDTKDKMVPVLEAEAEYMLRDDWTRLPPRNHWLRVATVNTAKDAPDKKEFLRLKQTKA